MLCMPLRRHSQTPPSSSAPRYWRRSGDPIRYHRQPELLLGRCAEIPEQYMCRRERRTASDIGLSSAVAECYRCILGTNSAEHGTRHGIWGCRAGPGFNRPLWPRHSYCDFPPPRNWNPHGTRRRPRAHCQRSCLRSRPSPDDRCRCWARPYSGVPGRVAHCRIRSEPNRSRHFGLCRSFDIRNGRGRRPGPCPPGGKDRSRHGYRNPAVERPLGCAILRRICEGVNEFARGYSPPQGGGVDAPLRRSSRSEMVRPGWSVRRKTTARRSDHPVCAFKGGFASFS